MRTDLCSEAIRLGGLARMLMAPAPPAEATALVALMLLHDSRRDARLDEAGDLVVLEEQDRRRWNHGQIAEALPLVEEALRGGPGPFALQAAIAALHCQAARAGETDWPQIVRLYDVLERLQPSPIVSLNRAAAVAMADGPRPALVLIDALAATGDLDCYHLLQAARADLQAGFKGVVDCIKAFSETDFTDDLKKFDLPTLILHGDDDQIVPIGASALLSAKMLKRATLKVDPGAPHGLCSTHKDQVNADLLAFLKA